MKSLSSIIVVLAASSTVLALPHGDKERVLPTDADTQALRQAIELLSSYEYGGNSQPHTKLPKGTGGIKPAIRYKRALDEIESLRIAIELLGKYEYGGGKFSPALSGPYVPESVLEYSKTAKRSPLKKEEEYELRQAIEVLSSFEYDGRPVPYPLPYLPLKSYKLEPGYNIPRSIPVPDKESLRVAIEILSKYEYGGPGGNEYHDHLPYILRPNEHLPRSITETDEKALRDAIELLSKHEYGNAPPSHGPPIKLAPAYTLKPIQTLKPEPIPKYDPAPYKPTIGKREIEEKLDEFLNVGDEESLRIAIELLSKYEYSTPSIPIKPAPGHFPPPALPYKPIREPYRPGIQPKRSELYPAIDREDEIRAAIELITKYEYQPGPIKPGPIKPGLIEPISLPAPGPKFDSELKPDSSTQ